MTNSGERCAAAHPSITVTCDELQDVLDELSICELTMREESALAGQSFSDLAAWCPDSGAFDKIAPDVDERAENSRFRLLLSRLGVFSPIDLSAASGADAAECEAVFGDPLSCDPDARRNVINGLESNMPAKLWEPSGVPGFGSIGLALFEWMRRNYRTPLAFAEQAMRCNLKCRLVGAVNSLDRDALRALTGKDAEEMLKRAAFEGDAA